MPHTKQIDDCWNHIGIWGKESNRCVRLKEVIHCRNCEVYKSASSNIYDREISKEYREEWTRNLAESQLEARERRTSIIVFRIGNEWLALPTTCFKEISDIKTINRIPHNKKSIIRGLANVGGEVEVCFSLGALLRIEKGNDNESSATRLVHRRIIVAEYNNNSYVFPVSEIGSIFRYYKDTLQKVPATVSGQSANYMDGVIEWRNRYVGLLNPEMLFTSLERELI